MFTSSNHLLDLLVVARPDTIALGTFKPTAWVFEMCQMGDAEGDNCPADSRTLAPYGGIRLQLSQGDHLRMRLINRLPPTEDWELVNVGAEAHNFHMHQTKFYVHPENAPAGDGGAMMDNVPLPNGGKSCDGSVDAWRDGECEVATIRVSIPFAEVGDFVYHCHIGEHQDGGMMAHILVIASK